MTLAPTISSAAALVVRENTFTLSDGTELFYRAWLPAEPVQQIVFLFHRGHEHSGRFLDVVPELALPATAFFAWDARGHGRSPGPRGDAPSISRVVRDIDEFVRHICGTHNISLDRVAVVGHSVAAVAVSAWVHDYAPRIRALVLVTPALRVKLYIPFAIPALRLMAMLKRRGTFFVKSYVKAAMLTHDPEQARRYQEDPLIARSISVRVLLGLYDMASRLLADAAAIRVPALLLSAGRDWVVTGGAQEKFYERLGSPLKQRRVFPGAHHDLLHEQNRGEILHDLRTFLAEAFHRSDVLPPLLDADQHGFTKAEYDRLRAPLPLFSPRGLWFATSRLSLASPIAKLSRGVRLGWKTGFNSGPMLDYVYENQARGALLAGRMFDRAYLNAIGWRGIRVRKTNLQELLRLAIAQLQRDGRRVHIVDIAGGPGRYLSEIVREYPAETVTAMVRDRDTAALAAGRELATSQGISAIQFAEGDGFDEAALAALHPAPDIAVVSGFYELFPDNAPVLASLRGLAAVLRARGGFLVYTNQPWHPELEMIARVLRGLDGRPWVMRRRTQEEMDDLVRAAGFTRQDMRIDEFGIFTVSLATIGNAP